MTPCHRNIHRRGCTLLCSIVVAAGAALGAGPATADPTSTDPTCPRTTAVLIPGTGETTPTAAPNRAGGMLDPIGQGLRQRYGADIDVRTLAYPASATPYNASESAGVHALSTTLQGLCPSTRAVLAGYSQGANIAGDLATTIGNNQGPLPASRITAVALLSDPRRDTDTRQLGPAQFPALHL